jgi:hypothetical protein
LWHDQRLSHGLAIADSRQERLRRPEYLWEGQIMQQDQSVSEMATEVLARQAGARAKRTGESLVEALRAVLRTEAGRRLAQLRDGEHRDERANQWQPSLSRERAEERRQAELEERRRLKAEERSRARKAAWESFMRQERLELKLRKEGQLAELLGEALAGETPAALLRLAREDQRQAEEGLVALTSNGKMFYKLMEELTEGDMAARIAAARLREAWLKERRDGWLDYGGGPKGEGRL